ncbi:uncharacterized protein LOC122090582 [Macadamia integrifolia]|uniref:uncharacterized protein LOC122090582 n=1 Tax=Macadamia integrifolia TaxID=60698 RepID=UPI001C4E4ED1|nr:uncharacterized protein LOC122090582 [Macadamia integrifolia]
MGCETWNERRQQLLQYLQTPFLRESFYIITISLLSLILPLAFLLLARLANGYYILSFTSLPLSSFLPVSFLYTNTNLLHLLVSAISVTSLLRTLMGHFDFTLHSNSKSKTTSKAYICAAWIFLCTFHICVVLGIEGTMASGLWTVDLNVIGKGDSKNLVSRVVLFIGLHETTLHWTRTIVRPVVDDTVFGVVREERWVERAAMAASFGGLWWLGLRNEVEALVVILEVKRELWMRVEMADLVNCWLYYLIATIALVRLIRSLLWIVNLFFCRGLRRSSGSSDGDDDSKV